MPTVRCRPTRRGGPLPLRELAERLDLRRVELAPAPRPEALDAEARVPAPVQGGDGVADGLEHPLHLVLAALVDRELDRRGAEAPDAGGRRAAVLELEPRREPSQRVVGRPPLDLGDVDLVDPLGPGREP